MREKAKRKGEEKKGIGKESAHRRERHSFSAPGDASGEESSLGSPLSPCLLIPSAQTPSHLPTLGTYLHTTHPPARFSNISGQRQGQQGHFCLKMASSAAPAPAPGKPAYEPPVSKIEPPLRFPPKPSGLGVDRPNFIIFMPDQLRYDALGCTGNKVPTYTQTQTHHCHASSPSYIPQHHLIAPTDEDPHPHTHCSP